MLPPAARSPRSRARGTRASGLTDAQQRQAASAGQRLRGARRCASRVATMPTSRADETEPREQQRDAARAAGSAGIGARDDRDETRALEHRNGLDADPRAAVDDRAQPARDCEVEHARDAALVDQIRLLGQRRRRRAPGMRRRARARPRAPPASSRARRRSGAARPARPPERAATSAASPVASARSSTKARSCARGERDRAGRRAHAAAGAEQRDVALVRPAREASAQRRSSPPPRAPVAAPGASSGPLDDADGAAVERLRAARPPSRGADQEDARVGAARSLAAHEIAGCGTRGVGRQQDVGIGRVSRRQQSDARAGRRARARSSSASTASPPSSARRTITAPRRAAAAARRARAGPSRGASATADGRAQRDGDAARALDSQATSNSRPRAATREPLGRRRSRRRRGARPQQPHVRAPMPEPPRARPRARRAGAATRRRRDAARRARGSRRRRGRSACDGRPASPRPVEHRRRAIRRAAIGTTTTSPARTTPPAASACRSASTAVCGSPPPGSRPSASATSASARPRAASQCSRSAVERLRGGSRSDGLGRRQRQSQREARAVLAAPAPTLTPPPCASAIARTVESPMPAPPVRSGALREGIEEARQELAVDARARRPRQRARARARAVARSSTRTSLRAWRIALSSRLSSACRSRWASTSDDRRQRPVRAAGRASAPRERAPRRRPRRRCARTSTGARWMCRASACVRPSSSRSSTITASRETSSSIVCSCAARGRERSPRRSTDA